MNDDPRRMLDKAPMSRLQVIVIIITVGNNVMDGFDVLAIGYPI